MSRKAGEKPDALERDADLEISDEELEKVSGGTGVRGLRGVRVSLRENPTGGIGFRDNPFGGKLSH